MITALLAGVVVGAVAGLLVAALMTIFGPQPGDDDEGEL